MIEKNGIKRFKIIALVALPLLMSLPLIAQIQTGGDQPQTEMVPLTLDKKDVTTTEPFQKAYQRELNQLENRFQLANRFIKFVLLDVDKHFGVYFRVHNYTRAQQRRALLSICNDHGVVQWYRNVDLNAVVTDDDFYVVDYRDEQFRFNLKVDGSNMVESAEIVLWDANANQPLLDDQNNPTIWQTEVDANHQVEQILTRAASSTYDDIESFRTNYQSDITAILNPGSSESEVAQLLEQPTAKEQLKNLLGE